MNTERKRKNALPLYRLFHNKLLSQITKSLILLKFSPISKLQQCIVHNGTLFVFVSINAYSHAKEQIFIQSAKISTLPNGLCSQLEYSVDYYSTLL